MDGRSSNQQALNPQERECLLYGSSGDAAAAEPATTDGELGDALLGGDSGWPAVAGESGLASSSAQNSQPDASGDAAAEAGNAWTAAQLERWQDLQQAFADIWSETLTQRLRAPVRVRLAEYRWQEYGEFVFGLEYPTAFQVLRAQPFREPICLEMHPNVVFPLMDRLLGGGLRNDPVLRRPLTEIELRLLRRMTQWALEALRQAWSDWLELTLSVVSVDSNPKLVRCLPPAKPLLVCEFDVDLRYTHGPVRMAFARDSLVAMDGLARVQRHDHWALQSSQAAAGKGLDDHAELAVVVAEMSSTLAQMHQLQVGDIIQTDTPATSQVQVRVDGETVYLARPGQYHGKRAFRIEQRVFDESG